MFRMRKSKHGPNAELEFTSERTRAVFAELRWRTVNERTRQQYNGRVQKLEEEYGGTDFGNLADYIARDKHTVATKRGTISAVADVRWCRYQPLPANAVQELTWALDVLECDEAERMVRATLEPAQLKQLFEAMLNDPDVHLDTLEGAQVMEDIGCRTFNIRDCTRERWDSRRRTVQCERKATELAKRRTGRYDVKPYTLESTHAILAARAAELDEANSPMNSALFPQWNPDDVGRVMRACAKMYQWPKGVIYCCYCLRHSAAGKAYEEAHQASLAAVRKKLAHKSRGNEERYGLSTATKLAKRGRPTEAVVGDDEE